MIEVAFLISVIGLMIYAVLLLFPLRKNESDEPSDYPFVSVLVVVRNESENIKAFLDSVKTLDYPKDRFEVLVGDDNSDDDTLDIIYNTDCQNLQGYTYPEENHQMTGKQYVLDQLLKLAQGDSLLFTDGDMILSPNWIQNMLVRNRGIKLKVGLTEVAGQSWFAKLQNIDWLLNQNFIIQLGQQGYALTVWGNNLATNRNTLSKLEWPVTPTPDIVEDVSLMHQVIANGGTVDYAGHHKIVTKHESIFNLMRQRKRWMHGTYGVPVIFKILGTLRLLFFPATLYLMSTHLLFGTFILIKCIFLTQIFKRLSQFSNIRFWTLGLLFIDLYELLVYSTTLIYYIMPYKDRWKGRIY